MPSLWNILGRLIMEKRTIWVRVGMNVTASPQAIQALLSGNGEWLVNRLNDEMIECGDSYIPDTSVEEYNRNYDENYNANDIIINL